MHCLGAKSLTTSCGWLTFFSKLLGYLEELLISLSLISSHLRTEYQESLLKMQIHTSYIIGNNFSKDLALGNRLNKGRGGK